ncbi:MAG: hypothetical protein ACUVWR_08040 [Anaerolineae bacterium]
MSKVRVCFWFDVEDYITPESDDALRSLLDIFEQRQARGTWKLVGEKFRVLQSRGRKDIIEALHRQDVGYHTDNHSQHPTISEYVKGLGWRAGVAEFAAREVRGLEELRAEFGHISCYGQPGGAWAPQAFPVLSQWGIPMYLDEGGHLGLGKQPFWFQNVLTVFNLQENCLRVDLRPADKAQALAKAKERFQAAVDRLLPTGGLISIYYHPCEFATSEFWDGVNFSHGHNTPRNQWRGAPLLPKGEPEARLSVFAGLLDLALEHPDVEVVDATQLLRGYRQQEPNGLLPTVELAQLAAGMGGKISYAHSSVGVLSPAQLYSGLVQALATWAERGEAPAMIALTSPLGPTTRAVSEENGQATVAVIGAAARRALAEMCASNHMPASLTMNGRTIGSATSFGAMATALDTIQKQPSAGSASESTVSFKPAHLTLEAQVGRDSPAMWSWAIFPEGFSAPDLMELTRLQAWTMKPARLQ